MQSLSGAESLIFNEESSVSLGRQQIRRFPVEIYRESELIMDGIAMRVGLVQTFCNHINLSELVFSPLPSRICTVRI